LEAENKKTKKIWIMTPQENILIFTVSNKDKTVWDPPKDPQRRITHKATCTNLAKTVVKVPTENNTRIK
jgi:hypothetical protein